MLRRHEFDEREQGLKRAEADLYAARIHLDEIKNEYVSELARLKERHIELKKYESSIQKLEHFAKKSSPTEKLTKAGQRRRPPSWLYLVYRGE
jgi:hypothetical protein